VIRDDQSLDPQGKKERSDPEGRKRGGKERTLKGGRRKRRCMKKGKK